MSDVKVYEIEMEVRSPLVLSSYEAIGNVFSTDWKYIPGHVIRGALFSQLMREGKEVPIREEARDPTVFFQPAYPVLDGRETIPAHPMIYKCKVCKKTVINLEKFEECEEHPFCMESKGGSLVFIDENGNLKFFEYEYVDLESLGINRVIKGRELEMLYSFIGISPNTKFKCRVTDVSGKLGELGIKDLGELKIGRGISRGFGLVELKIEEIEESKLVEDRSREIEKIIGKKEDNPLILLVKSPTFNLSGSKFGLDWKLDLSLGGTELKCEEVILTGRTSISGFSLAGGIPKAKLTNLIDIGSLLFFETGGAIQEEELMKEIARKELRGFGPYSQIGLNFLEVHPIAYGGDLQ
ncbi:hypothetical protein DRN46_05885 [Thermococci archaeon]|nr:MAG: hypothetical protein DRN46_05885 [Thermococci archaeon]